MCLSKSTVLRGARVCSHAWVQSSIVGWQSTVGKWVRAGPGRGLIIVQVVICSVHMHALFVE